MNNSYKKIEGERQSLLIFSNETLSLLEDINLDMSMNVSTYSSEKYIIDYINNIFNNITTVLDNSRYLITTAKEYLNDSINNIPTSINHPELLNLNLEIQDKSKEVTVSLKDDDSHLILRLDKNKESTILGALDNNSKLTILDSEDSEWIKVKTIDGKIGYVSSNYIKVEK